MFKLYKTTSHIHQFTLKLWGISLKSLYSRPLVFMVFIKLLYIIFTVNYMYIYSLKIALPAVFCNCSENRTIYGLATDFLKIRFLPQISSNPANIWIKYVFTVHNVNVCQIFWQSGHWKFNFRHRKLNFVTKVPQKVHFPPQRFLPQKIQFLLHNLAIIHCRIVQILPQ